MGVEELDSVAAHPVKWRDCRAGGGNTGGKRFEQWQAEALKETGRDKRVCTLVERVKFPAWNPSRKLNVFVQS